MKQKNATKFVHDFCVTVTFFCLFVCSFQAFVQQEKRMREKKKNKTNERKTQKQHIRRTYKSNNQTNSNRTEADQVSQKDPKPNCYGPEG